MERRTRSAVDGAAVAFDHHRLEVHRRALQALDACDEVARHLPPGRAHVRDQLDRAATSIVANIAEGAGEFRPREKARFYRMSRRSAIEAAAWLEIVGRRGEAPSEGVAQALRVVDEVVAMLVTLIKAVDRRDL